MCSDLFSPPLPPVPPVLCHLEHLWLLWLQVSHLYPERRCQIRESRESQSNDCFRIKVQKNLHGGQSGGLYLLTRLPGDPSAPWAPGGPMSVRLLMGQPWEHLARMEEAYWDIWAVITPLQSCRTCSSVRPGPCRTETTQVKRVFNSFIDLLKICLCYSHLWIIEQVSGDMKRTDGVTHTGTRGSFGSGSAFDAQVTEWTALSSGTWDARRSHRTGTAGTTDCTFGSTLWNEWTTNRLLCSDCSCLSFIIFNHFHNLLLLVLSWTVFHHNRF